MPDIAKTIPPRISKHPHGLSGLKIPGIIHQTFVSADLPERTFNAAQSWISQNPGFEYRFYDDDDQRQLIADGFGPEVLQAYERLPHGAFRADLWRYCALYQAGGVYADIDTVCLTSLRDILTPEDEFLVPNTGQVPHAVFNAFICCRAQHAILEQAIALATKSVLGAKTIDGYAMVGPGALGKAMNLATGRDLRAPHEIGRHCFGGLPYRILEKRAEANGHPRRVMADDQAILITKYEGYFEDLEGAGLTHWAAEAGKRNLIRRPLRAMRRLIS